MGRLMARLLVLALVCPLSLLAARAPDQAPPRMHIFTTPQRGEVPTDEERGRMDSVRDLRDAVAGHPKKVVLVSSPVGADVLVDVVSREKRDTSAGGYGGTTITPLGETTVRIHVVFGTHETDIRGVGQGYWARAAKDASSRLLNWVARMAAARIPPIS